MRALVLLSAGALVLAACGNPEEEAAARAEAAAQAAADSVEVARAQFDATAFDTVTWASRDEALVRGSVVFSYSCARCHGQFAEGDGGFVTRGDTLRPPDITVSDWRFLDDPDGLREFIYTGSDHGMPNWGLEGLKYKDVDAVATFLVHGLNRN
ncbi:MAG TPA: c-type cytochrome [Longimicrobiales bacterium]|nr:c-type cytochrome [Longimicrobiales bacterium]